MKIEEKTDDIRSGAGKEFVVTKDHSIDDVLKANKEGYSITFDGSKEKFVNFSTDDFAKLPKTLMVYYNVAQHDFHDTLDEVFDVMNGHDTMAREFGYDRRVADPQDQLKILWLAPGFRSKWVRAYDDQIATYERRGYIVATGKHARTFANPDGKKGHHYVGSEENPELILMVISDENYKKNEAYIKRGSEKMKEAAKAGYKRSIEQIGYGAQSDIEEK